MRPKPYIAFDLTHLEYQGSQVKCPQCCKLRKSLFCTEPRGSLRCGPCLDQQARSAAA